MAASEELAKVTREVQQRLIGAWPPMPRKASGLFGAISACLMRASNMRLIKDGPHDVQRKLKLTRDKNTPDTFVLTGGLVDGTRFGEKDHFTRDDGALLDFSITIREQAEVVKLLAYDFLIELPRGLGTPLLRFDLNLPGQANENIGLRSHIHPGVNEDQLIVPAPVMAPCRNPGLVYSPFAPCGPRTQRARRVPVGSRRPIGLWRPAKSRFSADELDQVEWRVRLTARRSLITA